MRPLSWRRASRGRRRVLDRWVKLLCCPVCREPLASEGQGLACGVCGAEYPVTDGVPQLIRTAAAEKVSRVPNRVTVPESALVQRLKQMVRVPSPTFETAEIRNQVPSFVAGFPDEACVANVGSAGLRHGEKILNVDLIPGPGVDVVGDATELPFRTNSLDGIISRRVLEHVCKPGKAVAEMHRVLKPGGRAWCEIPFLQGYHPTPTDFQRYTIAGLADLFDAFTVVESGVALGPSSTLSWVLREYLSILFAFNNPYLYKANERIFSWVTLPVKFLDLITARSRFASQIASSFYIVVEKK